MRATSFALVGLFALLSLTACNGSDSIDDLEAVIDLEQNPPERKPIDTNRMGVNAFFNTPGFGTPAQQYNEIRDTLGLRYVRVLIAWTNEVQPSPDAAPDFGFFDAIIDAIPPGVEVLVTVAHTPDWMTNPANWTDGDPVTTWVDRWLTPVVQRYANDPRISSWQIFNEPDHLLVPSDSSLGLTDPAAYFRMLQLGAARVRQIDPGSLVVLAASRSIQQASDANLNYNKALRDLGAADLVDIWAIHYYGRQYEKVVISGGVADFLNGLNKTIWMTESGEMGFDKQIQYVETTWPFLREQIPAIDRIFYYRLYSTEPRDITFGLRTAEGVSNLYTFLRDRPR